MIGGAIAYFVLKKDDPKLAMTCLLLGLITTTVGFFIIIGILASPGGINNILPDYYG